MIPCWENHPRTKLHLFWISQSNMFSSNRRNITGNGYDKKLLSLFQLVLQESGAKTAETIALASMEHNAIHWRVNVLVHPGGMVRNFSQFSSLYVCNVVYICVWSVYFTLEKLVPKKFDLHLVKPNVVEKKDTQIYFNWITIISVQDVIFDTKMGLKCNHAKYRAPKKLTFT